MSETDTLETVYFRFYMILNDLRKNGISNTDSELNLKFLNNLIPEWKMYTINHRQSLTDIDIHSLVDSLHQFQEEVNMDIEKNKSSQSSDPLALYSKNVGNQQLMYQNQNQLMMPSQQMLMPTQQVELGESPLMVNDEEDELVKMMKYNMALLSEAFFIRYGKKPVTNNQLRFTSASKTLGYKGKEKMEEPKEQPKERVKQEKVEVKIRCYNYRKNWTLCKGM